LLSLRESVSELKAEKLKLESQLNQAEKNLLSKSREVEDLKQSISQVSLWAFSIYRKFLIQI